jgi:hypothetical protein
MDLIDEREIVLPTKRMKPLACDSEPSPMKVSLPRALGSDSEPEIDDDYLDELEKRLDEKLGKGKDFDDVIFMKSPHDSILQAEGISTADLKALTDQFSLLPDGDELIEFAEFLAATKA